MALFLITWFARRKESPLLAMFSGLLFVGFIAVFIMFNFQFRYHDYYYFLLLFCVFFMLIFIQQIHLEGKRFFIGLLPILSIFAFYFLPFKNYFHSKYMLEERYKTGSYYHQSMEPTVYEYLHFAASIKNLIPDTAQIVTVFDPTPNGSLYFLRHRGIRIAPDFNAEMTENLLNHYKLKYMILNDTQRWEADYEPLLNTKKSLLYKEGKLSLWKLNSI
jgi:hypothetical protein